jgi:hypothetical protein
MLPGGLIQPEFSHLYRIVQMRKYRLQGTAASFNTRIGRYTMHCFRAEVKNLRSFGQKGHLPISPLPSHLPHLLIARCTPHLRLIHVP